MSTRRNNLHLPTISSAPTTAPPPLSSVVPPTSLGILDGHPSFSPTHAIDDETASTKIATLAPRAMTNLSFTDGAPPAVLRALKSSMSSIDDKHVWLYRGSQTSLFEATIKGAEFDSSDRRMPLRCHPGTRVNIIKRCQDFILKGEGRPRLRWVVGAAGVGKSAIMQSVAHDEEDIISDIIVGATIFFSMNGRQDGTKAITTMAYQLAVKIERYRLFVQHEVTRDPSLLQKSLPKQFKKFIVEPFVVKPILDNSSRLLVIIDGLDECDEISVQKELLGLISDFCIAYPTSPIVWMIASRPEPHITSFFSRREVALSYEKEEIPVDTNEAREDVKRYLRDKFCEIQMESLTLQHSSRWPSENDYLKVANASGGLLAYASMVVQYISNPYYGNSVRLLDDVLTIIETGTKESRWRRNHPMAQLDALYSHIMSKIPANVMADTRKLLLLQGISLRTSPSFLVLCNTLEMEENTAYSATYHIRAIAKVPGPAEAAKNSFEIFHKSFYDYLRDFERSGFSSNFDLEAERLMYRAALRILEQAPDGVYLEGAIDSDLFINTAFLKNGSGSGDKISISWSDRTGDNCRSRLGMFRQAVDALVKGIAKGEEAFRSLLCLRILTSCLVKLPAGFPFDAMQAIIFDERRRREFLEHGILKQVPLEASRYDHIMPRIRLRFKSPTDEQFNPWNINCKHKREGMWASQILDLTAEDRLVEFRIVDPEDGVSEWTYTFRENDFEPYDPDGKKRKLTTEDRSVQFRVVDPVDGGSVLTYVFCETDFEPHDPDGGLIAEDRSAELPTPMSGQSGHTSSVKIVERKRGG